MASPTYVNAGAIISSDQRYRYLLWREWRGTHDHRHWHWWGVNDGAGEELGEPRACVFVMFNPSTADGKDDDPTIRKCVGFAKRWRYERLEVVNLFAYRSTDPQVVLRLEHDNDPVGCRNQEYFSRIITDAGIIICAWGAHGDHLGQDETMLGWLGSKRRYALALTKDGHPRHPLYVPYATKPIIFRP